MVQRIGDALVSVIEQVDISASSDSSEIDTLGKDSQILVDGDNNGEEIEITFYIIEDDSGSISDVEDDIKNLSENSANRNTIDYMGNKGFISVDSLNIPEESDASNIRKGTITGKFLSYPKNFSDESFTIPISSTASFDGQTDGELTVEKKLSGNLSGYLILPDDEYNSGEYGSDIYGENFVPLSVKSSVSGEIVSSLNILQETGELYGFDYGKTYSSDDPKLSFVLSLTSSINSDLDLNGELQDITEISYGYNYGGDYGGYITGYGANIYGRDTYEG
jgi:hypothetical protein